MALNLVLILICTGQVYLFTASGVLPSLDTHSKHNIIYGSLNLHIPCPPPYKHSICIYHALHPTSTKFAYTMPSTLQAQHLHIPCPPSYKHKIWEYKSVKTEELRKELKNTNWYDLFFNLNVNEMSIVFSDRLMDLFSKHFLTR